MTGTPGQPPGGTEYRTQYSAELPEVMGRKLGLTDVGIALGQGQDAYGRRRATKGARDPNILDPAHDDYLETWDERFGGALDQRDLPTQGIEGFGDLQNEAIRKLNEGVGGYEQYLNPYGVGGEKDFVTRNIEDQFSKMRNEQNLGAGARGAFGERNDLALAEMNRQQADAVGTAAAQNFGQAQQLRMQDISSLMQMGGQQQQLGQAGKDAEYREQLQEMYEPYQRLGFVSDIMQGSPTSASSLAMATTPQANPLAQAVGAGISGLALYQGYQNMTNTG